jgi:hypothetical protein
MKTYVLAISIILLSTLNLKAQSCCQNAACSGLNILPNLQKHVVGLRYMHRQYAGVYTKSLNPELNGQRTIEKLNTLEAFGRFNVHPRWQLTFTVPYNFLLHQSNDSTIRQNGLGDITVMAHFLTINPAKCSINGTRHQLRAGFGLKLPTGKFLARNSKVTATGIQLGTGALDVLLNAIYTFRYKNFGFNTFAGYRLSTYNTINYKYNDRISAQTNFFYAIELKNLTLLPNVGVNYEYLLPAKDGKNVLQYTQQQLVLAGAGFDVYYKKLAISIACQPTLWHQTHVDGDLKNKWNIETGIFYNF